jgi:hypothetical protein
MSVNMSVIYMEYLGTSRHTKRQNLSKLNEFNRTLEGLIRTTDQKVGGSNPSGRTNQDPLWWVFFVAAVSL